MLLLIDHNLLDRIEVKFRAREFCMSLTIFADSTVEHFKLVKGRHGSIPEETEVNIVHMRLSKDVEKVLIGKGIDD